MNIFKQLNKYNNANWAFADQALVSGVNFATGLLLARLLGINEFGVFTLIWMGVLFVSSIQMAMISSPMISIGPKQLKREKEAYYNAVIMQQVVFSIVSSVLLYVIVIFSDYFKPDWAIVKLALPLALACFFYQNQDFIRRYFFSQQRALDAFINDSVSYLGQLVVLFVLLFFYEIELEQVLWVIMITSAIAVIIGLYKINLMVFDQVVFNNTMRRHWEYSKWSTLSALLQWFSGNLVFILTGIILGPISVGVLKATQNIMAFSHVLFQAMENFVPVKASQIYINEGRERLNTYKNKVVGVGGVATLLFISLIAIFADDLLLLVYGEEYTAYSFVLQWFSVIYFFMFLGFPYRAALRAIEDTKAIFKSQVFASLFVIAFGYTIIQAYELQGALVTLLIVYVVVTFSLHHDFSKNQGKDFATNE